MRAKYVHLRNVYHSNWLHNRLHLQRRIYRKSLRSADDVSHWYCNSSCTSACQRVLLLREAREKTSEIGEYTRLELEMAEETVAQLSNIWSVDDDEVELKRMIGQGSFGDVWTARYRDQSVAIKILKIKAEDCTDQQLQEFKDESDLLRSIFHGNIVRFIGTGKTVDNKPFIVLEYIERGSMRNELNTNYSHRPMEYELQVKSALHAAKGMRHLHRIDRMHRDLKCDNLLINDKGTVKVADLGCTKMAPKITVSDGSSASVRGSRVVVHRYSELLKCFAVKSTMSLSMFTATELHCGK